MLAIISFKSGEGLTQAGDRQNAVTAIDELAASFTGSDQAFKASTLRASIRREKQHEDPWLLLKPDSLSQRFGVICRLQQTLQNHGKSVCNFFVALT